jgi:hypothetical protein
VAQSCNWCAWAHAWPCLIMGGPAYGRHHSTGLVGLPLCFFFPRLQPVPVLPLANPFRAQPMHSPSPVCFPMCPSAPPCPLTRPRRDAFLRLPQGSAFASLSAKDPPSPPGPHAHPPTRQKENPHSPPPPPHPSLPAEELDVCDAALHGGYEHAGQHARGRGRGRARARGGAAGRRRRWRAAQRRGRRTAVTASCGCLGARRYTARPPPAAAFAARSGQHSHLLQHRSVCPASLCRSKDTGWAQ